MAQAELVSQRRGNAAARSGAARDTVARAAKTVAVARASQGTPLKGLEAVAANPSSKRALFAAVARTGITAVMASLIGLPAASKAEDVVAAVGYRRLVITAALSIVLSVGAVVAVVLVAATAVLSAMSYPMRVVESMFGDSAEASAESPLEYCTVPSPSAVPTIAAAPADVAEGVGENGDTFVPPPPSELPAAIDGSGKATEDARALMREVPRGADPNLSEAWVLHSLSHPANSRMTFTEFTEPYRHARDVIATRSGVARDVTSQESVPTASAVVREMDPYADIAPYTLAAASAVTRLAADGTLNVSEEKLTMMQVRVTALCRSPLDTDNAVREGTEPTLEPDAPSLPAAPTLEQPAVPTAPSP